MSESAPTPARKDRNSLQLSKQELSPSRSGLLELMQSINFGQVLGLIVRHGEPILDPLPRILREHKFGSENGPRPELASRDFHLKSQVVELFGYLDQARNCTIEALEIKHGLPFRMIVAEVAA